MGSPEPSVNGTVASPVGAESTAPRSSREESGRERKDAMLLPRVNWTSRLATRLRELGPYTAIELLVPGGSLIALSLWAFRHRAWFTARTRRTLAKVFALMPDHAPTR